jgi:predicted negative regulator of RcsB-dependent stress response
MLRIRNLRLRDQSNSRARPRTIFDFLLLTTLWLALVLLPAGIAFALVTTAALPQADQDALFNQAVQAYQQNQFNTALRAFGQVTGAHAQEAQQYVSRIKAYMEAWSAATTVLQRSPDERDARSLEYAISELQAAIAIKADGPGHPQQELDRARQLKEEIEKGASNNRRDADQSLCDRALAAAKERHYIEARDLSCMLANDNPGYACGGNEAVYICHLNTELAKMDKSGTPPPNVSSSTGPTSDSASLDKAKAAYDSNDFQRAQALFQKVTGDSKPAADEFLNKISQFTDFMANGEKLSRDAKYDDARTAFLGAAAIKTDGPGNPQSRAATMELFVGLDRFYSGDYAAATQHLSACAQANNGKQGLIHFYLGASKLAQFFVTGADNSALHDDAINDLKLAKQAGFKTDGQDVSPKILQAYNQL